MDQIDHNAGLQGAPCELPMRVPENPPPLGFSSLRIPANNMYQPNWDTGMIPTPSLEPINEAAFDMDMSNTFPGMRQVTEFSSLPVPLGPEGPLTTPQGAHVPVEPPIDFNSFGNMNLQISGEQMPYTADVNLAYDLEKTSPELTPALGPSGHIPNINNGAFYSHENTGWFINAPNLMMGANPPSGWANPPFWHNNGIAAGDEKSWGGVPAGNGLNITTESLRIRGKRSPPQRYEGDVGMLCDRLIGEGADIATVMFLRYVILANEVTIDALLAPLQPSEVVRVCGGARWMWEMLLETKEVMPGEKKYCCLLCPVGNRREYRYGRDAIRHFNKDHLGFSYPCEYCNHQYFRDAERRRHAKECRAAPAVSV